MPMTVPPELGSTPAVTDIDMAGYAIKGILLNEYLGADGRKLRVTAHFPVAENCFLRFEEVSADGSVLGRVDINPNRQAVEGLLLVQGSNPGDIISFEEGFISGSIRTFLDSAYFVRTDGIVLTAPNESRWRIVVDNAGILSTVEV